MKLKSRIAAPNRPFLFLIHVAAPIVLGSGIYVLVRSPHLRCFGWLRAAGLSDSVAAARMAAEPLSGYVPSWFLYSLPDSLWTYALTSVMLMLWYGRASVFKPLWLGAGPICGIGSELGQLVGLVRGTFDTADLLLNTLADPQFRKDMAIETSKEFVLKQLKAPATAQWPRGSANYSCVELGDDQYRVTSYVDAQNSFGAQIRTFYTVVVKYQGNGQWSLVSIETQP